MSSTKLNDEIKTVLITGGSGLVGMHLSKLLTNHDFEVIHLSRSPSQQTYQSYQWDVEKGFIDEGAIKKADAIIHLAGSNVAGKRWNNEWKNKIYKSRIDSTALLRAEVKRVNPELKYFLSASAIGFYGWDSGSDNVTEVSKRGDGFLADVVVDWEKEVHKFSELTIKHAMVRIGIVLSDKGGAIYEMARPIKLGMGAALGQGSQYMSWIHISDLCNIFLHLLRNQSEGIFNGVAPHPVSNKVFTRLLAKRLKRPIWLPNVPKFALQLIVGEMADILVGGNRVSSQKIENSGYKFKFPTLEMALKDLLH